jgi:uncharacterized protein YecE (DUF72 family)
MGKQDLDKLANDHGKSTWDSWSYQIGCPVWACKDWSDLVYPRGTKSTDYLNWYSHAFPTVEGNSTFYAVPPVSTFQKWAELARPGFEFCFKFPKLISHDRQLENCDDALKQWIDCLSVLFETGHLGPTFLQLGPSFSPKYFDRLKRFLSLLPREWPWAVEVRHLDWFDTADNEAALDALLVSLGIDRVLFDSRPLNSREASDGFEVLSQTRKPKSPFRTTVTGRRPLLRLIGRNDASEITTFWEEWAKQISQWIEQGLRPIVFTHAPDDRFAPELVWKLHELIRAHRREIPKLPLPVAQRPSPSDDKPKQLELF